jgi:hypothetical protein
VLLMILIPLAWGYVLARRILRESQLWLRWSLAYALGLLSVLIGVNLLFHWLPLRTSLYITVVALALGTAALLLVAVPRASNRPLGCFEGPVLAVLTLTAFFEALFWQMQWSDDDFFIHAPLMALFLRDVFPQQNPYFPNLALPGHYGRDLSISALSVLVGGRFLATQYIVTALNQAATVIVGYFTARRYLRSSPQALWAILFAFVGLNFDGRRGLIETFQNNNSFAFLFLFVNIYLFLVALTRRSLTLAVLAGASVGTYALIYESSYGLLMLSFAGFPLVLCALRRRWRLRYLSLTAGLLLFSAVIALVQGGMITEVAQRVITPDKSAPTQNQEERRMSHELRVHIPKPGFTITGAFTAEEYPLWSPRLLEDAGTFVWALPLTLLFMLWRRRPWGILIGGLSTIAILIPAAIDFGAFNSESLRFLIVGGVGAAMLFGVVLGAAWEMARSRGRWARWMAATALIAIAVICFWPATKVAFQVIRDTGRYPRDHYLVAEEWGCTIVLPRRPCEPIDVSAAVALRPYLQRDDRVLVGFRDDDLATLMSAQATFSTFAHAFLSGPGMRILPEGNLSQLTPFWDGEGFRARAFFATGDVDILDDLGVRYVYLNPDLLSSDAYRRIRDSPRLARVVHVEWPGGGAVREAYRVNPAPSRRVWTSPDAETLVEASPPSEMQARSVYPVRLTFISPEPVVKRLLRISYEIRLPDGQLITKNDEIRLSVGLQPSGAGRSSGTLWLATPYEKGEYDVLLYGWDGSNRTVLRGVGGRQAVVRIRIA